MTYQNFGDENKQLAQSQDSRVLAIEDKYKQLKRRTDIGLATASLAVAGLMLIPMLSSISTISNELNGKGPAKYQELVENRTKLKKLEQTRSTLEGVATNNIMLDFPSSYQGFKPILDSEIRQTQSRTNDLSQLPEVAACLNAQEKANERMGKTVVFGFGAIFLTLFSYMGTTLGLAIGRSRELKKVPGYQPKK